MIVHAQLKNPILKPELSAKSGIEFINDALSFLVSILLLIGFLFFLIHFMLGAYKWISSEGDKGKIDTAQKQITYGFIGLGVILSIFAIMKIIGFVFGVQGLENLQIVLPTL